MRVARAPYVGCVEPWLRRGSCSSRAAARARQERLLPFQQAGFTLNIELSGNYGFLNHLTVARPRLRSDDAAREVLMRVGMTALTRTPRLRARARPPTCHHWARWRGSWPVVANLLEFFLELVQAMKHKTFGASRS